MTPSDEMATETTGDNPSPMFGVLDATSEDVVAVRVGRGTRDGYHELYDFLAEVSREYGKVHVYEEAPEWTLGTYLSNFHGIMPDLRRGSEFDIGRYAAVADSLWAKLLYYQWRAIAPVWPVSPDEMRYFGFSERDRALEWVRGGEI